ncbi:hypothetical protein R1flu_000001 [Riccia fluitans]|uniref:Uncharacterized protein n=1 Tax=Riccia fluitans TaxID=41844 RepID=A0ABD1XZ76_9MARC
MDGAEARDLYPAIAGDAREAPMSRRARGSWRSLGREPGAQRSAKRRTSCGVRCAPTAPENPEERVLSAPGRTHNRIRSPRPRRAVGGLPELLARRGRTVACLSGEGRRMRPGGPQNPPGALPRAVNGRLRTGTDKGNPTV